MSSYPPAHHLNPRILFVDDEENILKAVCRVIITEQHEYDVVTTTSPKKALEWIQQGAAAGTPFAVIVSDQQMPEMSGTRFLEQARYLSPDTIRILLTGFTDVRTAIEAINRGAIYRYLEKPWHDEQLKAALDGALGEFFRGIQSRRLDELAHRYHNDIVRITNSNGHHAPDSGLSTPPSAAISNSASVPVASQAFPGHAFQKESLGSYNSLTRREKDLLHCIVQGYSNQQIADDLSISITTVKNHIGNIFRKLKVSNRTQAAMLANAVLRQPDRPVGAPD